MRLFQRLPSLAERPRAKILTFMEEQVEGVGDNARAASCRQADGSGA
jgi:hypothetical protein